MKLTLLSLLLCLTCSLNAQMRQVYLDVDEVNSVQKMHFISPSEGFVAFERWIGYTQDSGRTYVKRYITWSNVNYNGYSVNLTFGFAINGVYAFDSKSILVYGHYGFVPAILSSKDGGNTFTLVYQGVFNPNYLYKGVLDMYFSGTTGLALVDDKVLKTTNSGNTWALIYANASTDFLHFNLLDIARGFIVAQNRVLKTVDGGNTWQTISLPQGFLRDASFVNEQNGWCVMDGMLYRTATGGTSWTKLNDENSLLYVGSIQFLSDSTGFAIGSSYNLLKTTDGGKSWEKIGRDNRYSYLGYSHEYLYFLNSDRFWAGGGHGFLEMTTSGGRPTLPLASFVVDYAQLNTTNTINLTNKSKPGYTFKWFRNSTQFATTFNASYVSNRLSIDTIRLVAANGTLTDTAEQIIETRANYGYQCYPGFVVKVDTSTLQFTASDSTLGAKHTWTFGDGSSSFTGVRGSHKYDSVGSYVIKHVVSSDVYGCKDSSFQTIGVERTRNCLVSDFAYAADSFFTNKLTFKPSFSKKDESAAYAQTILEWNWGDGKPSDRGAVHAYDAPGRYDVCLKVQNFVTGCINSVCKSVFVYIDTACNADFQITLNPFQNTLTFYGKPTTHTTGIRNTWTVNNRTPVVTGNVSSFQPLFIRENYGETNFDLVGNSCGYPITLELCIDSLKRTLTRSVYDSSTGCSSTVTKTFNVPREKNVFIRATPHPSFPQQYTFYAYEIDSRGDTLPYGYSSRWRVAGPGGAYYVGDYYGSSTTLSYTFKQSGNFTVAIASNRCNAYGKREVYYINVAVTADSCPIFPPDFSATVDTTKEKTIKFADPTLNANLSLSNSWKWYYGDGDSSTAIHPSHTYAAAGTYKVMLVYTNPNGCSKQVTKSVVVPATRCTVKAGFEVPVQMDATKPVLFTNTSVNSTAYAWDLGDASSSTIPSPSHIYQQPGSYTVKLIASNGSCADTIAKNIAVLSKPDTCFLKPAFIFTVDTTQPLNVQFVSTSVSTAGSSFSWSFGDGGTSTVPSPLHTYNQSGKYKVCLTIKDNVCERVFCDSVAVEQLVQNPVSVYPNPVSGTLTVTFVLITTSEVYFQIYDQTGKLMKRIARTGQPGNNMVPLDVSDLQPGLYFLQVSPENHLPTTTKFVKQ